MLQPMRRIRLSPLSGRSPAALNFIAARSGLLICALFLLVGLVTAGDYAYMYDADIQRQIAQANLDYIRGQADRIETELHHDRVYGVAFELPVLLAQGALGLEDYYYIHRLRLTLTHLFFILGAFCCYRLAYHLSGRRTIALFALLIFLLHPRIYAHSFFNPKDLPFLSMFSIALYLLERAFRRDTLGAFVLLGIGVGLLINLRIMGIMLLAAALAMRGLDWLYAGNRPERKRILGTAGLFVLTAGLTLYAVAPYAWANPVDYLTASLKLATGYPSVWPQLFQGELILSDELPPYYAAVYSGITTPPLILLLGFIGIAAVLAKALPPPPPGFPQRSAALLPAAAGLLSAAAAGRRAAGRHPISGLAAFVFRLCALFPAGGPGRRVAGGGPLAARPRAGRDVRLDRAGLGAATALDGATPSFAV